MQQASACMEFGKIQRCEFRGVHFIFLSGLKTLIFLQKLQILIIWLPELFLFLISG